MLVSTVYVYKGDYKVERKKKGRKERSFTVVGDIEVCLAFSSLADDKFPKNMTRNTNGMKSANCEEDVDFSLVWKKIWFGKRVT